jgi:CHAT domain-containing protein
MDSFVRPLCCFVAVAVTGLLGGVVAPGPAAMAQINPSVRSTASNFDPQVYRPGVLRLSFTSERSGADTSAAQGFVDITLIPPEGPVVGRRVVVATRDFVELLRQLYAQLSRQDSLDVRNPASAARQLYRLLLEPIDAELVAAGITTLLISADPGLQAVPFAALHDGQTFFGERLALSLTPSLGLMPLDVPTVGVSGEQMAAGASRFEGLSSLPLVPQEVDQVKAVNTRLDARTYLNETFTPQLLLSKAGDSAVAQVHVATHAEFLPGGPSKAKLHTGTTAMPLSEFASLRQRRDGTPLNLFVLSACRTALGDRDSELGFAGLALQAGARSAIGSLWYVDDVATSAFFVQFYRYLDAGVPKAEAMQAVRRAMVGNRFVLQSDDLVGPDGQPVLTNLTPEQKRRIGSGFEHPYFWSGIALLGTPW